ncbi:MFS general substrate transporter [Phaeosphaeriaceae sp. SRC1lsM3a]|nr:MFS general substrate transporter [Stagonospora sp. SRC1lsM3a]
MDTKDPEQQSQDHQNRNSTLSIQSTAVCESSEAPCRPPFTTLLAFTALCLSIFLVALDTVLIPTALPTIALSFHVRDYLYAWIGSAYLLANAASVPFWGKLSDIFGRKYVILTANLIFLAGSIICGVSTNATMLIAGRVVQGLGGGGVVVLVHVCVSDLFAIRDRSFYLGLVGAVWAVASALGPVLGGIFAERLNWRVCFYINIPIVSVSILTLYATLHLPNPRTPLLAGLLSLDWLGTTTILAAVVLLLVGLQVGCATSYTAPVVITLIIIGSTLHILFVATQWWQDKRGRQPVLPLRIFKDVSNLSALGVCGCDALAFNSVAYFLPLYFQIVLGKTPSISGTYMLAIAIPLATVSFVSGWLIEKTGRFLEVLQSGLLLMTVGVGLLISLGTLQDVGKIIAILFTIGLGFGPNFGAPLIALQTRVQESDIATGTAAFAFVRMIFGAFGVIIGQVIFQLRMATYSDDFSRVGIATEVSHQLVRGEAISLTPVVAALPAEQMLVAKTGLLGALRGSWIFYTGVSALGLLISLGIKRKRLQRETNCQSDVELTASGTTC